MKSFAADFLPVVSENGTETSRMNFGKTHDLARIQETISNSSAKIEQQQLTAT